MDGDPKTRQARKRADGDGSMYQRKDGLWVGELMAGYKPNGTPDRRRVSAMTQAECRRKLAALRLKAQQGTLAARAKQGTLDSFIDRWLLAIRASVKPSTHKRYGQLMRLHIIPTLGKKRLDALRASDVQALLGYLLTQPARNRHGGLLTGNTVKHVYVALHVALEAAVKWGDVARNVCDLVDPPRIVKVETYTPSPAECARLMAVAASDPIGTLVSLAVYTGARQGELLGLQWPDIDAGTMRIRRTLTGVKDGVPTFGTPKTARSRRTVTLPAEALAALRAHRQKQLAERLALGPDYADHNLVFATALGTPYRGTNIFRSYKRLLAKAGLPASVRFHDLRHAAATNSLLANVPLKVVSERLGHSNLAITADLYMHTVASLEADAAEKLAALYRDAAPDPETAR